ncbi:hypothetical protein NLJ89_g8794 [Agrocybe chaxingu]|uniref:Shugoshin C-terminal domain-containing protein n=1 Tax=Agrocybe chaxingu TaxID=84603 RepID=A0A9W8K1T1_9AGAR|nr:hypothetical protein NLJ89_g8794 [Agrocybe chaxingu]
MSRRESRSSLGARQNDALFEFESFKKKFLLANKHITKLNSTLSVRIEELNAQISTLYVENLRLRASEIALASQLKREREQSRKVLADAEAALTHLRTSLRHQRSSSSDGGSPTLSPLAKRSVVSLIPSDGSGSPQLNKISRPPNVPGIYEDDEPISSDNEVEEIVEVSPPRKKSQRSKEKEKTRERASKLPVLTASLEPHAHPTPTHVDLLSIASSSTSASKPRRTIRRQSGLLTVNTAATEALSVPRSGSPAFGSPIRLEAGFAEEEEERAVVSGRAALVDKEGDDEIVLEVKKEKKKGKSKDVRDSEKESEGAEVPRPKEKKRKEKERDKEKDFDEQGVESVPTKTKSAAKDHRSALQPIDSNVDDFTHSERENKPPAASPTPARQFLRPVSPSGGGSSRGSSSPVPAPPAGSSLGDETAAGGRERRQRKSVNYAEPKLNT